MRIRLDLSYWREIKLHIFDGLMDIWIFIQLSASKYHSKKDNNIGGTMKIVIEKKNDFEKIFSAEIVRFVSTK